MPLPPAPAGAPVSVPAAGSRRAEIALAAAEEFTRRGYHSTRVEHIADRLSVTPGALYRHVPGKYEMFRDAVFTLSDDLATATRAVPPGDLDRLVASTTETTLAHRTRAALYRWQGRYLGAEDRSHLALAAEEIRQTFETAVLAHRGLDPARPDTARSRGARSAASAILSTIASLGDHRVEISAADAVAHTTAIASDLASSIPADPASPSAPTGRPAPPAPTPSTAPSAQGYPGLRLRGGAATREAAISSAIARFHRDGYDDVSMETIGADVGVAASALYRHFSGKSALLTAAVDRTAAFVENTLDDHAAHHSSADGPAAVLGDLLDGYVRIAFSHGPELMLYYSELGTLDPEDRRRLRASQRRQLQRWIGLVRAALPGTDETAARVRVQAALAVVLDGGRAAGYHPSVAGRYGELARIPLLSTGRWPSPTVETAAARRPFASQASGSTVPRE